MKTLVDIIIPTYNNTNYLRQTLESLINARSSEVIYQIFVVNNGHPNSCDWIDPEHKFITVVQSGGENLGWEGGLLLGLKHSKSEFVMFLNDDVYIPYSEKLWMNNLLQHFRVSQVGAVGPSSNMVMGLQNMLAHADASAFRVMFLIGFCMLVRRKAFDEAGGVETDLPGGDDLDLSIRLRNKGYYLIADKNVFVFHYGMTTGNRIFGDYTKDGGWNSPTFTERVNDGLIRKHGFRQWWETTQGAFKPVNIEYSFKRDSEGEIIRKKIDSKGKKIIDIACGNLKTWPNAIGIDIIPGGKQVEQIGGDSPSLADICADVSKPLPLDDESVDIAVARHVLEHMINPIEAIRHWIKPIKKGGSLVISVPNEHLIRSIPMNPEHVVAFTPENMPTYIEAVGGLKIIDMWDGENGISFTTVCEKLC